MYKKKTHLKPTNSSTTSITAARNKYFHNDFILIQFKLLSHFFMIYMKIYRLSSVYSLKTFVLSSFILFAAIISLNNTLEYKLK